MRQAQSSYVIYYHMSMGDKSSRLGITKKENIFLFSNKKPGLFKTNYLIYWIGKNKNMFSRKCKAKIKIEWF